MSERETGSAPPGTWTYATLRPSPSPAAAGRDLAVQRAADDRQASQRLEPRAVLLRVPNGVLERRVRELHHVRAGLPFQVEPSREVRVEDVEAAGPEPELDRLGVHEHVVPERHRPGQPRIGHAGPAVDLQPDEPVVPLRHRGDGAAAEAKHRVRPRRARA